MSDDFDDTPPAAPTASNWEIYHLLSHVDDKIELLARRVEELHAKLDEG